MSKNQPASLTADFTSYVWYRNKLSPRKFTNLRGKLLYRGLRPFEIASQMIGGCSVRTTLLQRHLIINSLLSKAIEKDGVTQVLELGSGLSPRGIKFCADYQDQGLVYVEADLPKMVARKKRLLEQTKADRENHHIVDCDVLAQEGDTSIEAIVKTHFKTNKPLIIITEGLVNYFELEALTQLWKRLNKVLAPFPKSRYFSDIYPEIQEHPSHLYTKIGGKVLAFLTRSKARLHFKNNNDIYCGVKRAGFSSVAVYDPGMFEEKLPIPKARKGSFVRIFEAQPARRRR